MNITRIASHVLQCDMAEELGYSQQFYRKRTAHIVEVETDAGITGWGECFGPGTVALANRTIVEQVIQPMVLGADPMDRDVIWHKVYNLLRDHGRKGMPLQALSGVDIALWDIAGKAVGQPIHKLIGGAHRDSVPVYGYGMMLRREDAASLAARFADEAAKISEMGFVGAKMKVGLGPKQDVALAEAVRRSVGDAYDFMVDANHCYTTADAFLSDAGWRSWAPSGSRSRSRQRILKVTRPSGPAFVSASLAERPSSAAGAGGRSWKAEAWISRSPKSALWAGSASIFAFSRSATRISRPW